jgi:hypothetical protein
LRGAHDCPPLAGPSPPLPPDLPSPSLTCPRGRRGRGPMVDRGAGQLTTMNSAAVLAGTDGWIGGVSGPVPAQRRHIRSAFWRSEWHTGAVSRGGAGGFSGIFEIVAADKAGRKRRPICAGERRLPPLFTPSPPLLPDLPSRPLPDPGGELGQGTISQPLGRPLTTPTGDDAARRSRSSQGLLWARLQAEPVYGGRGQFYHTRSRCSARCVGSRLGCGPSKSASSDPR